VLSLFISFIRLRHNQPEIKLSSAARETLTIIAYREPIARADIEGIRGVQSGDILQMLLEKGLIRIAGRDDSLGRPMLYRTTKRFLQQSPSNPQKEALLRHAQNGNATVAMPDYQVASLRRKGHAADLSPERAAVEPPRRRQVGQVPHAHRPVV
jgi:hypothetical protein